MAKKKATKAETLFPKILQLIEGGESLTDACKISGLDKSNFNRYLNGIKDKEEREEKRTQYAYAREERAEKEFEEIRKIADGETDVKDTTERIQRDRLRIDARKWRLGKMQPKKYGDKMDLDVTSGGEKISISLNLGDDEPKAKTKAKTKAKNKR